MIHEVNGFVICRGWIYTSSFNFTLGKRYPIVSVQRTPTYRTIFYYIVDDIGIEFQILPANPYFVSLTEDRNLKIDQIL